MDQQLGDIILLIEKYGGQNSGTSMIIMELRSLLQLVCHFPSWIDLDEDGDIKDLFNRIQLFITKARQDLHLLCDGGSEMATPQLYHVTFDILEDIWLLKPDLVLFLRLLPKLPAVLVPPTIEQFGVTYMESLVDSVYFLCHQQDYVPPGQEQLEVLEGKLGFLKSFLFFVLNNCNGDSNEFNNFWDHVTAVVKKAACCICLLLLADDSDEDMADCISFMLLDLLQSIKPAKSDMACVYVGVLKALRPKDKWTHELGDLAAEFANFILEELMAKHNSGSCLLVYKARVQKLQVLLMLLLLPILWREPIVDGYVYRAPILEAHNESLMTFDLVVNEFGMFINSLDIQKKNEDLCQEFDLAVSSLVQKMEPMVSEIIRVSLKIQEQPALRFTQVNTLGCLDFVSENLRSLLDSELPISEIRNQIEEVLTEVSSFRPVLEGFVDQQDERKEVLDVCNHMISLFLKFEFIVDMFVVELSSSWNSIYRVPYYIRLFKEVVEFVHICRGKKDVKSDCRTSKRSTPIIDEAVVGLEDQIEGLVARLTGGGIERKIIPIIGMPGIGKTTLAKRIYNDKRISNHFDIQAWCSVSPIHTVSELVQDILFSIVDLSDEIYKSTKLNSPELVYRRLYGRRYLIVLDEVWSFQNFDELCRCLPNNQNGSRILVTSGQNYRDPSFEEPLLVRLLTLEESWELLQVKYNHLRLCTQEECRKPQIPNENCPAEVGKQIAVKCQGLPLAIVLIAGFLVNIEDNQDWLTITEKAFASENRSVGDCEEIVELSYKNMPVHLRQCFLYFAAFPQSTEIPVSKLTRLWVSEGFVQKDEVKKAEEVAEDYLNDLMGRSLIMEAKRRSKGGVKSCRIHDYLHHFCRNRTIKENVLPVASQFESSFLDSSICLSRTLIYPFGDTPNRLSGDIPQIWSKHKLLRVLDLGCFDIGNTFPPEIAMLLLLRFLSLKGGITYIPSSITNLRNLETFLVKGTRGEVALPDTLFSMRRLTHAHIDHSFTSSNSYLPQLEGLQTLSTPSLSYETGNKMTSFLFLQKLRCIFLESWGHSEKLGSSCNRFPVLVFLNHLQSLHVIYQGRVLTPCEFNFPSNIKKLTLSKFRLPWVEIAAVAALPYLEVLKLLSGAFEGDEWNIRDDEFPKLKFLKLGNLNITRWNISDDSFLGLEHVVLHSCKQLIEIPSGFGYSCTLKKIEVLFCGDSVAQSAREIEVVQREEMATQQFSISIQNPNKDYKQTAS